jgi:hypothetical protein
MRSLKLITVLLVALLHCSFGQSRVAAPQKHVEDISTPINGEYVGLEPMENLTPEDHAVKWFHENTLIVRNNDAILDKVPLTIKHGQKTYSASDGGFATYRGKFFQKDGQTFVSLRLFQSDYIMFPTNGCEPYSEVQVFPAKLASDRIEINGARYAPTTLSNQRRKHFLRLLSEEPLEYTGAHPYRADSKAPPCR